MAALLQEPTALSPRNLLAGVGAFLDAAAAARRSAEAAEEEALQEALGRHAEEDAQAAEKTHTALAAALAPLLPPPGAAPGAAHGAGPDPDPTVEALPRDGLAAVDQLLDDFEAPVRHQGQKPDRLPEQLLAAEPGSKLYPGLIKKLQALAGRTLADTAARRTEARRAWLLQGGQDPALDARRAAAAARLSAALQHCGAEHARALAQSDHQPVQEASSLPVLASWNTLEFPSSTPGAKQVFDGVSPHCDQLLRALGRKGADEKRWLLDAMGAEPVLSHHRALVLATVRALLRPSVGDAVGGAIGDAVGGAGRAAGAPVDAVLLQEVSRELQEALVGECVREGWSSCFSEGNDDPERCDAITAIISRRPLEEMGQVSVEENRKVRHFARARLEDTWIVSCHVPHEVVAKGKKNDAKDANLEVATRVLLDVIGRFLGEGSPETAARPARQLAAGGDWNADVRAVAARAEASHDWLSLCACDLDLAACRACGRSWAQQAALRESSEGGEAPRASGGAGAVALTLCAPEAPTQLGGTCAIDGIFRARLSGVAPQAPPQSAPEAPGTPGGGGGPPEGTERQGPP